ncbi:hypothetical protein B4U80_14116 [Leptotrombidium deliense]|uniref:Uncharacterized protein n=1 Tax=Leptotrombidium deliense TaxID=299467 RepID=A0A443S2B1_9ACAR|nr:hypothetical protein B4U80_14116 [Leptotrombidium deliense]
MSYSIFKHILPRVKNVKHLKLHSFETLKLVEYNEKLIFTKLEMLQISLHHNVKDEQLIKLITSNKKLMVLDVLTSAKQLSENHIEQITENCTNLRLLKISNQRTITEAWFRYLLNLPKLEMLCLPRACWNDMKLFCIYMCEFIFRAPSLRVIQTLANIDILKAMIAKAKKNESKTYFCNFPYKYSPDLYPNNFFTFLPHPNIPETGSKDKTVFPFSDYFSWKKIPIRSEKMNNDLFDVKLFFYSI